MSGRPLSSVSLLVYFYYSQATLEDPFDSDSGADDIKLALFNLSGTAVAAARAPPPLKRILSRAASSLRGAPAPVEPFSRPAGLGRRLSFLPGCHADAAPARLLGVGGSASTTPAASPSTSTTRLDTLHEKSAPPRCRSGASPPKRAAHYGDPGGTFYGCDEAE